MKQITITVPDNCELKQDGNTYTIVEKENKLSYEDIAKNLFMNKSAYYIDSRGSVIFPSLLSIDTCADSNNCTSKKQAKKLIAINKLMNVAKYLNCYWKPDWNDLHKRKYYIYSNNNNILLISETISNHSANIYFKSEELAKQAIEILGEETIKLALCTDY